MAAIEPPSDAVRLCGGHVTAAASEITWTAWYSRDSTAELVKRYGDALGEDNHSKRGQCDIWQFPKDKPTHVLDVCAPSSAGPWLSCSRPPAGAASIVAISSMARSD